MKHSFLVVASLGAAFTCPAQQVPVAATIFQNYWLENVPEAEAAYRVRRTLLPGVGQLDSIFQLTSNQLWSTKRTSRQANGDTLTTTTRWRASGKLFYTENVVGRSREGEWLTYDAAGQLQSRSLYAQNNKLSTQCLSPGATQQQCEAFEYLDRMAMYPGGMEAMLRYLGKSMRYPAAAKKQKAQGRVFVSFFVTEAGELRDIRVTKGVTAELDAEALRIVKQMQKMPRWQPGIRNGELVPVSFTLPLSFKLN